MITWIGADVGKEHIVVFGNGRLGKLDNEPETLKRFFRKFDQSAALVIEGSGGYCRMAIEAALAQGITVYAVNPADFRAYRDALNYRAKSDPIDAELLARYGQKECDRLRAFHPGTPEATRARALLGLRDLLVKSRSALAVSFSALNEPMQEELAWFLGDLSHVGERILQIEQELAQYVRSRPVARTLMEIPGIGILTASALDWVFDRCQFSNSDQLVAFVGLDVRVRDSGKMKGARKLTKRGDALVRKLCINAAHSLRRSAAWRPLFLRYANRGLPVAAVDAIVARKLLRIAFALIAHGEKFDPRLIGGLAYDQFTAKTLRFRPTSSILPPCARRLTKTPRFATKIPAKY